MKHFGVGQYQERLAFEEFLREKGKIALADLVGHGNYLAGLPPKSLHRECKECMFINLNQDIWLPLYLEFLDRKSTRK